MLPAEQSLGKVHCSLAWLASAVFGLSLSISPGFAFDPPKPRPERQSLETVYDRLQETAKKAEALEVQEGQLAERLKSIQQESVLAARRAQALENDLAEGAAELQQLRSSRDLLATRLRDDDKKIATLLATLQRLNRNSPELHALASDNPLNAARAEIIMRAVLPGIVARTTALRQDVEKLAALDLSLAEKQDIQRRDLAKLNGEADRLDKLRAERRRALGQTQEQRRAAEALVTRLSKDAETLSDLVRAVEAEAEAKAKKKAIAAVSEPSKDLPQARPQAKRPKDGRPKDGRPEKATVAGQSRQSEDSLLAAVPAIPVGEARGQFIRPASGQVVRRYGAKLEGTQTSKGIEIASPREATVVAPFDGSVAFAGTFRGYGRLLIIDHGGGYHSLLAGLSQLDGQVGEAVLAGEPIGSMGRAAANLYYELRRNGDPIDPQSWLAPSRKAEN